jgi:hypothetical protein
MKGQCKANRQDAKYAKSGVRNMASIFHNTLGGLGVLAVEADSSKASLDINPAARLI